MGKKKKEHPVYNLREDRELLKGLVGKTFELTEDVENPEPDRRSPRDIRMVPVWSKGTRFSVRNWYGAPDGEFFPELVFSGHRSIRGSLIYHSPKFRALVEKSAEVEETFRECMAREGITGRMALEVLERMEQDGVTTRKYLVAVKDLLEKEWDEDTEEGK